MNSIVECVFKHASENPNNMCIADQSGSYNYDFVWKSVKKLGYYLTSIYGLNEGDRILVECTQDYKYLIIDLACELLRVTFIPYARKANYEVVNNLASEVNAKIVLHESKYNASKEMFIGIEAAFRAMDEEYSGDIVDGYNSLSFPSKNVVAEILFTTGTTGKSKGIEITHEANVALAENIAEGVKMRSDNVELIPLPLNHSHALRCCYANLYLGAAVVITEGVTRIAQLLEMIELYGVTAMDLSPSAVLIIEKLTKGRMMNYSGQIRYVQVGTAALQMKEKEYLMQTFPKANLFNFYGATESGRTCVIDFNNSDKPSNCIGKCTKNALVKVVDSYGRTIKSSADCMGRLAFSGKMNMLGYFGQPTLTKEVLVDGFVYTNDIGYVDDEGFVYLFGRAGDIINYGGIKIAPEEIEDASIQTNMLVECACVAIEDQINGQAPKLFVVPKNKEQFDISDFRNRLVSIISKEKMPKAIEVIDEIPRSENGKILRRKLL